MSLQRIKSLYCIIAISIAVILDCTGGVLGWATAVVVLAGALPMFDLGCRAAEQEGARGALIRVKQRALADLATDDPVLPEAHPPLQQAGAAMHPD